MGRERYFLLCLAVGCGEGRESDSSLRDGGGASDASSSSDAPASRHDARATRNDASMTRDGAGLAPDAASMVQDASGTNNPPACPAGGSVLMGRGTVPSLGWIRNGGADPHTVAVDANGNVFVAGELTFAEDLGGGYLEPPEGSPGDADAFIVSYTARGDHRWSARIGGRGYDRIFGIGLDANGNVYGTGEFGIGADFGEGALTENGVFVLGWDNRGAYRWSTPLDVARAHSVAVEPDGTHYVTGDFGDTADFGDEVLTSSGYVDTFLASYDASGAYRWSLPLGGTSNDFGRAVVASASGGVEVIGSFDGEARFGSVSLTSAGSVDIFVASFDRSKTHRWSSRIGQIGSDSPGNLAVGANGVVYATGYSRVPSDSADAGPGDDDYDYILTGLDSNGDVHATLEPDPAGFAVGASVAADSSGNLYVAGRFGDSGDFGGGAISVSSGNGAWIASYDASLRHRWSVPLQWVGPPSGPDGVAVGPGNVVYVIGHFFMPREGDAFTIVDQPFIVQLLQDCP